MIDYWHLHPYTVTAFLAAGLVIAIGNYWFVRRLDDSRSARLLPLVSVLVPSRNEAENIEACVLSLLEQNYAEFEVLVLDDHSTDDTRRILGRLAASAQGRLSVLDGSPLPVGWLGKHWACHQLVQSAKGELLLFTDADTRHAPNMLRDTTSALIERNADLLTAFPREETVSWGEKLTVPILGFATFSFVPVFLAQRFRIPALSITIGQLMLFRRSAYEAIGGHAAVREHAVDDVALGRRLIGQGLKWTISDGADHVRCRMYTGFGAAVDGFTKNLFAFFDHRAVLYLLAWTWMGIAFLEPPAVLLLSFLNVPLEYFPARLAWIALLESLALFAIAFHRLRFPSYLVLLYPVIVAISVFIALRSFIFTGLGLGIWKARRVPRPVLRW